MTGRETAHRRWTAPWFRPSGPAVAALVVSEDVVGLAAKAARGGPAQTA